MGLVALLKWVLPILLELIKPSKDGAESKLTPSARITTLTVILLVSLLGFVTDKLYIVHTEKMELATKVAVMQSEASRYIEDIQSLESQAHMDCPRIYSTPEKPEVPKPELKPKIVISHREKMLHEINNF